VFAISFTDWGGGPNGEAQLLGVGLLILIVLALTAYRREGWQVILDLRTLPAARAEVGVCVGTISLAVLAGYATNSAFASRYTAVIFPLVILLAAYGATRLPLRAAAIAVTVLVVLGAVGLFRGIPGQRTQAKAIAAYIVEQGLPGDVVIYCPDQLGPAVSRLLPADRQQFTYPEFAPPQLVDWVDYADRQDAGKPKAFADAALERRGEGTLWVVWSNDYRTVKGACGRVVARLEKVDSGQQVLASGSNFEHAALYQFGPGRTR
jgi:hypothetical protein